MGKSNENSKNIQHLNVKKKIMFNKDEDYYFITYNILIILKAFGCKDAKSKWTDYTKLSYLIPLVADSSLLDLFIRYLDNNRIPPKEDLEILRESYYKSRLKLQLISSILFTLEANHMVTLVKNEKRHTIDIWVNLDNIPDTLMKSDLFEVEIKNLDKLKTAIKRLKGLSSKTLLERLYTNNGVRVWEV